MKDQVAFSQINIDRLKSRTALCDLTRKNCAYLRAPVVNLRTGSGNELDFSRQNTKGNGNVEYFSTFPLPLKFPKMANKYQLLIGFGRRIPKKERKNCQTRTLRFDEKK